MKAQGREPVLPFNPAPYLTDWLLEIGPSVSAGDSTVALAFSEMAEWSRLMGVDLSPWEARTLRRLSRAFVNQQAEARKPSCIEPMVKVDQDLSRNRVEAQFAAMVSAFRR